MYLNILKNDLRRKKIMNIILLIFIILAATFISSSVNNLISISKAMEDYFEKAQLSDFIIMTMEDEKNDSSIVEFLNENKNVDNWTVDESIYSGSENFILPNGEKLPVLNHGLMISSFNIRQQKFFDSNNNEITHINQGEVYMPISIMEDNDLKVGQVIGITKNDFRMDFTIVDSCKDAFLGSSLMGMKRFIFNDEDYEKIKVGINETTENTGYSYSVNTSDIDSLERDYNQNGFQALLTCNQDLISKTYVFDMVMAGILLILSICLILISFVILRFTIIFTLQEEFREIGIMKAIGIKSRNIRELYMVKYLAISTVAAVVGFFIGIPFGNMFINKVSRNIIISNNGKYIWINILSCLLIIGIIMLFSYLSTKQINKFSPIDAIRNGSNGERFKRKGLFQLNKSKFSTIFFMALNDILSEPKKFMALIITFSIGIILVIVPINTISTLESDKMVTWFGKVVSDLYLVKESELEKFWVEGQAYIEDYLISMEEYLAENDIDTTIYTEIMFRYNLSFEEKSISSMAIQSIGIGADQYDYIKGQPPKYENEVAITHIVADSMGAEIGDTIKIKIGDDNEEFLITAIYQSLLNMGLGLRFSETLKMDYSYAIGFSEIQIKYNNNLSTEQEEENFKIISDIFSDFTIKTNSEFVNEILGDITEQLKGIKGLIVLVVIGINILVAVLMVKAFITKEKGEIAILKSIGFDNRTIMEWQSARIGIILIISTIIGTVLSGPIGQISSGKIFEMMGASKMDFLVKPLEVYLFYPLIIFLATISSSVISALQVRGISIGETSNVI